MSRKQHRGSGLPRAATDKAGDIRQATLSYDNWMRSASSSVRSWVSSRLRRSSSRYSGIVFVAMAAVWQNRPRPSCPIVTTRWQFEGCHENRMRAVYRRLTASLTHRCEISRKAVTGAECFRETVCTRRLDLLTFTVSITCVARGIPRVAVHWSSWQPWTLFLYADQECF